MLIAYLLSSSEANQSVVFQPCVKAGRARRWLRLAEVYLTYTWDIFTGVTVRGRFGDGRTASVKGTVCCAGEVLEHRVKNI